MLRLVAIFLLLCISQGCERVSQRRMKTRVSMADTSSAGQLLSGFYDLEQNRWRWTARRFIIAFPGCGKSAEAKPHSLKLDVFVPEGQIQSLGPLTLTAEVNGTELAAETFRAPGVHTYMRTVPETALLSNIVPVTFYLDRAKAPGPGEGRELGLVVNNAQLTSY